MKTQFHGQSTAPQNPPANGGRFRHAPFTIHHFRRRRGIALLLVMITLVVCSILTAGFLSSQGTSIGIARNERDAEKAHAIAQSGIELCTWLIKNRSDWRTAMSPGTWLSNYTIGEGKVTVTTTSGDGTGSFNNDTSQPAILTAVGSYGSRIFTLTATLGPTGGGTVFRGGNFSYGRITMGQSNGNGNALIDSYNSGNGTYSATVASNAQFTTNYSGVAGLIIYASSNFNGTFTAGKDADLGSAVYTTWWFNNPSHVTQATQNYDAGSIVVPNLTGLAYQSNMSRASGSGTYSTPGTYDTITASGSGSTTTIRIGASGIYHITGNVSLSSLSALVINSGVNAVIVVDGNVTLATSIAGSIQLASSTTSKLTMYVAGSISLSNSATINSGGKPTNCTILGTSNNSSIGLSSSATIYSAIYAPAASVTLDDTSKIFGAIIAKNITLLSSSQFHHDIALKDTNIPNITGGSAPQGIAAYALNIVSAGH